MRVVVCGAGNVGLSIAQYLGDAYDITLVDQDSVVLAGVTDKLDVRTVTGHAGDPEVLKKAEAHRADIFIAVTGSDEVNIVACQMAHSLFDVQLKIARLRLMNTFAPSWFDPYKKSYLPIDIVISAEEETAQEIIRHLKAPFASSVMSFFQEKAYVLGIQLQADSPLLDYPIKHLDKVLGPLNASVVRVVRHKKAFIPATHHTLNAHDMVYILVPAEQLEAFTRVAGYQEDTTESILILGGGRTGLLLASHIEESYPSLSCVLIEYQNTQTRHLVSQLSNTIILQGDALDPMILEEAGVQLTDYVIAITDDDRVNILGSLLAKRYGAKRAITMVQRQSYVSLMSSLNIEKPLNPSFLTISLILQRVRKNYVVALHHLDDSVLATLMEIKLEQGAYAIGKTIASINRLKEIRVFAVLRKGALVPARDEEVLEEGDHLLIFSNKAHSKKIKHYFEPALNTSR
ncbi:MAG: Trk system potassium transporter TrkA [Holosporaceae bacterium]